MRFLAAAGALAALSTTLALTGCDLLPQAEPPLSEQPAVDTTSMAAEPAGAQPSRRARRSPSRRPSGVTTGAAREGSERAADSAPPRPPAPTPAQRARMAMAADLERLVVAQNEHIANEGRYSSRLSRLGLRYIPHAGVSVQILDGDAVGWSAVATHADFPEQRCGIWIGSAPPSLASYVPAEGVPGCIGR